ncbi:MAG: hypothetical protein JXB05_17445 [Myxococcaceae bacterium]|nr:hypothetical protein [Myxococcaceae bacterium]
MLRRVLVILKTRESGHDPSLRELVIDDGGLHLGPRFDGTEALLTDSSSSPTPRPSRRRSGARKRRGGRR